MIARRAVTDEVLSKVKDHEIKFERNIKSVQVKSKKMHQKKVKEVSYQRTTTWTIPHKLDN